MGIEPYGIGPFDGGVNLVDSPTMLEPNELSFCLNTRIGLRGDFYKRPGHDNYGSSPAVINGNNIVNLILRYYKADGTKSLIAAAGGKLRKGNDSTGAWTDISINGTGASMSAANLADWMVYKNRLYITDGVAVQRYNGTDDIYAGHIAPAAPTLAQVAGGSLTTTNTYKYFVTSTATDMGEGPKGSVATITLTGSNRTVNLSVIADAAAKYEETFKNIYRTKGNGTLFYLLTTIAEGVTTFSDTVADSALGTQYVECKDPPVDSRFCIMGYDERAYWFGSAGVNASLVSVSDVGFPDRVLNDGINGFFTVANNDGDVLTGAGLTPGGIVFFKRASMWLLRAYGYGLINIEPKDKRGAGIGSTAPFSIVATPLGLIFLSQRGEIYLFDGTNTRQIGRKVSSQFIGMTTAAMNRVVACYHDFRYIISYDYRGSKGYNWRTMEYDTITDKWEGPFENGDMYNPSYYSVWDSQLDKGELYWGEAKAATGSYVYGRTEFSVFDRGNKFISTIRSGGKSLNPGFRGYSVGEQSQAARPAALGEVKTVKAFADTDMSTDTTPIFTHIDEKGIRTSIQLNNPIATTASYIGTASFKFGAPPTGTLIWGGKKAGVIEGSLKACRSRLPLYEVSDGGTATRMRMNTLQVLAEVLPLK